MKLRGNIAPIILFLMLWVLLIDHAGAVDAQEDPPDDPIVVGDGILMIHTRQC